MATEKQLAVRSLVEKAQGGLRGYLESRVKLDLTDLSIDGLWALSERGEQMEMAGALLTGLANRELSTRVDGHTLTNELKQRGKTRSKFYYAIGLVHAFESLPETTTAESLAALGPTKVRATLGWSGEERTAFASGQPVRGITIEDAAELSTREFEQRIKAESPELAKARAEAASLKTQLETARTERDRALKQAKYLLAEEDMPYFALAARQEVMAHTEGMALSLDMLDDVIRSAVIERVEHPEAPRFQPIVAATAYYALGGILARVHAQMVRLAEQFDAGDQPTLSALEFSPGEYKLFADTRERIAGRLQADAQRRETRRENSRPGKVGRKRNEG